MVKAYVGTMVKGVAVIVAETVPSLWFNANVTLHLADGQISV